MRAPTEENVAIVDEMVLCQEDQPQIHPSIRQLALPAVIRKICSLRYGLKETH